jgi:hypothetical protein
MAKIKSTSPNLVRQVDSTEDCENSREVLKSYIAAVKSSLEEHQAAFDAAVVTYRAATRMSPRKRPAAWWRGSSATTCREFLRCSGIS